MPFNVTQRQVIVFTAGITLGAVAAWAAFGRHGAAPEAAAQALAPQPAARAFKAASKSSPAPVPVAVGACAFTPVVATAAGDDGQVQLQSDLSGRTAKDVDSWILDGKEAVAAGRQRDAESDFLMACRAAEKLGDSAAMAQAEAMYNLGRHYAALAGAAPESRSRELWRRSEGLFAASWQAYNTRYGESSDKTRFTAKGLAEARAHTQGGPVLAAATTGRPGATPAPKVATSPEPAPAKLAKAAAPVRAPAPVEAAVAPTPVAKAAPVARPTPVAKLAKPTRPEPAVAAAPAPAQASHVAVAPTPARVAAVAPAAVKETQPTLALAKPAPRKSRPAAVEADGEAVVVEPPARAVGSAVGGAVGSATGDAHDSGYAQ